jgi:hypothetical protein
MQNDLSMQPMNVSLFQGPIYMRPGKPEVDPSTTPASNQSILAALLQCIALRLRQI